MVRGPRVCIQRCSVLTDLKTNMALMKCSTVNLQISLVAQVCGLYSDCIYRQVKY